MSRIFKCVIGDFNIKDAFSATDLLYEDDYLSVSCVQKSDKWIIEILSSSRVELSQLHKTLGRQRFKVIENAPLEDVDWLQRCFENFKPITVGCFYIYGPHLRESFHPADKISIEIAAATAFGTGEHATTNRCLLACEAFFDRDKHKSVLDIGCGSCILSIALTKLGAKEVVACDNDPEAVRISKENILINKAAHRVKVFQNHTNDFSNGKYDFLIANILAEPLIEMSEAIVDSLNEDGLIVLSGFTSDDRSVEEKFTSLGLKKKYKYDYQNWTTLVLER